MADIDASDFPKRTLVDDALAIRSELIKLIEYESETVIVIIHSYGGLVGCEAIPEELAYSTRQAQGLSGGVVHLFFFAAFLLGKGQSVLEVFGESPNNDVKPDGRYGIKNGKALLYGDLPDEEASSWASRLILQSRAVESTKITLTSYSYIPSTYLVCRNDQACPPQYQEIFAGQAKAQVEEIFSGHSPMLSHLDILVEKITTTAERVSTNLDRAAV